MMSFVLRRVGYFLIAGFAASILIFVLIRAAGGNVAAIILGQHASAEAITQLQSELGLLRPFHEQYFSWMADLLTGDLGRAFRTQQPVIDMVAAALPVSVPLATMGLTLSLIIAVPLGTYAAVKQDSIIGTIIAFFSQIGIAIPVFWAGVLLALLFGVRMHLLPTGGWTPWSEDPVAAFKSLILPAVAISLTLSASLTRYVRTAVLDIMNEEYIRTSRATGMTRTEALMKVGLRNAILPVITVIGIQIIDLISGTVLVETVFSLPGLARMLLTAVAAREVVVVQSTVMLIILFVLMVNLVIDLLYGLLDPRIRLGGAR